ncbi:hypothetical protein [Alicyclobacillus sp. ALC3]|uniref:hypothetical protein n=1 Tax=Alicyclobacillus sp. ALC3 TaxID=2796143 RepID=UPI0023790B3F|nr:hypothetical protein [Alicyclobacillus sp. ALC3]WDL96402.1 hypothetical protein JC200_19065 [Alicyclobacillus sp. ALC3]
MAQLSVEAVSLTGGTPSMAAADANGDAFSNDGHTMFRVTNGGVASATVTVASPQPCNYGYNHDVVANVAAGTTVDLGPFPPTRFNDNQGNTNVTYSEVTSLTVSPVRV